jgi:mono/diheme cytochrome c family protein
MNRHFEIAGIALLMFSAPSRPAIAAPAPGDSVEIWVRGSTDRDADRRGRTGRRRVYLDRLPLTEVVRRDAQYEEVRRYRGIPLNEILKRYAPDKSLDLAILHFANGMAVPVPFRDPAAMKRLDPFIARGWRLRRGGTLRVGAFPAIAKKDVRDDPRPIEFSGNKLVVAERWHPDVAPHSQPGFSPWAHADTVVGIELAGAGAYFAQFEAGNEATVQRGLALFRQNCQFCHGVRHVGASFGWDFVDSSTSFNYQDSAAHLYHSASFKPRNAAELGLMMPALSFLTEADAAAIRAWLQAISKAPMQPYAPPASAR